MADKIIKNFSIDLSDLPEVGASRGFTIKGEEGSEFILEVKDVTTGYYYNFFKNSFVNYQSRLENFISSTAYKGSISFPAVTGSDDEYQIQLYAKPGTKHNKYVEVRFEDGSLDINSSTGSNSLMLKKVIYQYTDVTVTLRAENPESSFTPASTVTFVKNVSRGSRAAKIPFSLTATAATDKSLRILKQPELSDFFSRTSLVVGSAPSLLNYEDQYPLVTETAQHQNSNYTGVDVTLRTPVPDIKVGDKWTVTSGVAPDQIHTVESVTLSEDSLVTVFRTVSDPAQNVVLSAYQPLEFRNQVNYRWPIDDVFGLTEGMIIKGTNVVADTVLSDYVVSTTTNEGTEQEQELIKFSHPAIEVYSGETTIQKGFITGQAGDIVFNNQQPLLLAGDTITAYAYGPSKINSMTGYEVTLTDLKIELNTVVHTTTAASAGGSSANVVLDDRDGIFNGVSVVNGIGIDPTAVITVSSGGSSDSAGTVVVSAAQSLESGVDLVFSGAGKTATISGNIEINKVGTGDVSLYFDLDNLLVSS